MQVQKRNGAIVSFDHTKIEQAVSSAGLTVDVLCVVDLVVDAIRPLPSPVSVETIQDHVERVLLARGHREIAKAYMAYRDEKTKQRQRRPVSSLTRAAFDEASKFFPTQLQQFQYFDKYSRFSYPLGRRETWVETVDRSVDYLVELTEATGGPGVVELVSWLRTTGRDMMLRMEALPSMRLLAMAGEPARRQNLSIYNCSAIAADCTQAFVEMLVISMAGCGVGFSVENQYVSKLPPVQKQTGEVLSHVVGDSVEGWATALQLGLERWFAGQDVAYDFSAVREAGAPLKTKGGRASGPAPLRRMLAAIRRIILARQGDRLRSLDAHDIACYVGEAAVQGGMRRTAMISLSDSGDTAMVAAKHGSFDPVRWNANNSAVWTAATTDADILEHFIEMHRSRNGERGVFNRAAAMGTMPVRRRAQWQQDVGAGMNPCAEVVLRLTGGLCNLSIAVARPDDTVQSLQRKVTAAAVFGTIQSTATFFPGLRPIWKENAERERLLGVDITGQQDCPLLVQAGASLLDCLRAAVVTQNEATAAALGINPSLATTCIKPSGNSSTLLNCAPGLHARHSAFYVRNVRVSAHSPVYKVLRDAGAPLSPENGQTAENATTWVCSFPCRAPVGATVKADLSAIEQLEYWKKWKLHYTEHNPSVTVTYRDDELVAITEWCSQNRDILCGVSFLPHSDAAYEQMPYIEITEDEYNQRTATFPTIDWSKLVYHEHEDLTTAAQEIACAAGACLI